LIRLLQRDPDIRAALDRLRGDWVESHVIHGDVRWDNFLVVASNGAGHHSVKLVDWELSSLGDPCWDIGCFLEQYVGCCVGSFPVAGGSPPERFIELSAFPLERMHPAIQGFWRAYVRGMGLPAAKAAGWVSRMVEYAGARLLQSAFELAQTGPTLTGQPLLLAQVGRNVLRNPLAAANQLLGLTAGGLPEHPS